MHVTFTVWSQCHVPETSTKATYRKIATIIVRRIIISVLPIEECINRRIIVFIAGTEIFKFANESESWVWGFQRVSSCLVNLPSRTEKQVIFLKINQCPVGNSKQTNRTRVNWGRPLWWKSFDVHAVVCECFKPNGQKRVIYALLS